MANISHSVVIITTSGRDEANRISNSLLERRLAACINILPEVESRYWWGGKIETQSESLLLVKTRTELLEQLTSAVKQMHTYKVPEIISFPISSQNQEYLDWLTRETSQPGK